MEPPRLESRCARLVPSLPAWWWARPRKAAVCRQDGDDHYEWFIAIRDAASRELLYALHKRDLGLFDAGAFQTPDLLGFVIGFHEECRTFAPNYTCTTMGADLTRLALEVGQGSAATTVRSGEVHAVNAGGRALNLWVGAAARVRTRDHSGCDHVPNDVMDFAIW